MKLAIPLLAFAFTVPLAMAAEPDRAGDYQWNLPKAFRNLMSQPTIR
jgi:hypothetical protein